ncbi:MAG: sugar ABC transporter permease [Bacilli bacterium]|nr:sugar ABC transporter permease [Bacilli bacterium]
MPEKKSKKVKQNIYAKWGYLFIAPFFLVFTLFTLVPLLSTFFYSFFEYYSDNLDVVGPNFVGLQNYFRLFQQGRMFRYFGNTFVIWILGFVPQIILSLLLAVWFTDIRLKLRGLRFWKTIIYMPNLVMASAFGMLFLTLFAQNGPILSFLFEIGALPETFTIDSSVWGTRGVIAFINFLMWFGNTTLLLMAGVMGIDNEIYEAAAVDGSGAFRTFFQITMPLLMPIFIYVFITSLIGGIQLFDVAQIFTRGSGNPNTTSTTLIMYLNQLIVPSKNYGMGGAFSTILFIVTLGLSSIVFRYLVPQTTSKKQKAGRVKDENRYLPMNLRQFKKENRDGEVHE